MTTRNPVGIEAISTHIPRHFIDLKTLAKANGTDPDKYYHGLGGRRMAVIQPGEDPLTLAVEAARKLFDRYSVKRKDIGLVIVGTETAIDAAKPIAAYVHGILGLPGECRTFDTKHACYGCTAALKTAADWCRSGSARGRKALVIATDIARYDNDSPGEPTQGAGAVAMIVGQSPALLALEDYPEAVFTEDAMDFWRPHYRSTAVVDGHASIDNYLKALESTYRRFKHESGLAFEDYDYLLFHVPFPKMAFKAFRLLYEREMKSENGNRFENMETDYRARSWPALWANIEIGNVYAGSLYISLASLLEKQSLRPQSRRLGFFSYGSGCCAEFFSGRVGPDASAWEGKIGLQEALDNRIELDHASYRRFRAESERLLKNGSFQEDLRLDDMGEATILFCGIRDHQRVYSIIPDSSRRRRHDAAANKNKEERELFTVRVYS